MKASKCYSGNEREMRNAFMHQNIIVTIVLFIIFIHTNREEYMAKTDASTAANIFELRIFYYFFNKTLSSIVNVFFLRWKRNQ